MSRRRKPTRVVPPAPPVVETRSRWERWEDAGRRLLVANTLHGTGLEHMDRALREMERLLHIVEAAAVAHEDEPREQWRGRVALLTRTGTPEVN